VFEERPSNGNRLDLVSGRILEFTTLRSRRPLFHSWQKRPDPKSSSMKYELLPDDTILFRGRNLVRVRRLSDGLHGGYIESASNLSQDGACFPYRRSKILGRARATDDAQIYGVVDGNAVVSGKAVVYGEVGDDAVVSDAAQVFGKVYGNARVCGQARLFGEAFDMAVISDSATVYGRICGCAVAAQDETVYGIKRS
jgi:hypothetical protein